MLVLPGNVRMYERGVLALDVAQRASRHVEIGWQPWLYATCNGNYWAKHTCKIVEMNSAVSGWTSLWGIVSVVLVLTTSKRVGSFRIGTMKTANRAHTAPSVHFQPTLSDLGTGPLCSLSNRQYRAGVAKTKKPCSNPSLNRSLGGEHSQPRTRVKNLSFLGTGNERINQRTALIGASTCPEIYVALAKPCLGNPGSCSPAARGR